MNFEELAWLFSCDNRNRGILRMNFDEAALLWKAVRASSGPMLEVGSRFGDSAVLMLSAAPDRALFSIDLSRPIRSR